MYPSKSPLSIVHSFLLEIHIYDVRFVLGARM